MKVLQIIGAIAAMIFTAVSTVTMWIFAAASLANANPDSIQRVKIWVLNFSLLSFSGIGIGIWLLVGKRYGLSSGVSLLPAAVMFIALFWQIIRSS